MGLCCWGQTQGLQLLLVWAMSPEQSLYSQEVPLDGLISMSFVLGGPIWWAKALGAGPRTAVATTCLGSRP